VGGGLENKEAGAMKCTVCGAQLQFDRTDLPLKTAQHTIVILKSLPVLQCANCSQYLIEDAVLCRVEEMLAAVDSRSELEVIRFAA
jgi:YgiT-type zinc finger domain-containing protein